MKIVKNSLLTESGFDATFLHLLIDLTQHLHYEKYIDMGYHGPASDFLPGHSA